MRINLEIERMPNTSMRGASGTKRRIDSCTSVSTQAPARPPAIDFITLFIVEVLGFAFGWLLPV
ncbi:hypothetical protein [Pontibacter rugosus]